jgi:hypothetical protein
MELAAPLDVLPAEQRSPLATLRLQRKNNPRRLVVIARPPNAGC